MLDFRLPCARLPRSSNDRHVIVEVPMDSHPFGVRGVEKLGIAPPLPAIANAIADATRKTPPSSTNFSPKILGDQGR